MLVTEYLLNKGWVKSIVEASRLISLKSVKIDGVTVKFDQEQVPSSFSEIYVLFNASCRLSFGQEKYSWGLMWGSMDLRLREKVIIEYQDEHEFKKNFRKTIVLSSPSQFLAAYESLHFEEFKEPFKVLDAAATEIT